MIAVVPAKLQTYLVVLFRYLDSGSPYFVSVAAVVQDTDNELSGAV